MWPEGPNPSLPPATTPERKEAMIEETSTHRVGVTVRIPEHILLSRVWADAAQEGGLGIRAESAISVSVARRILIDFAKSILETAEEKTPSE